MSTKLANSWSKLLIGIAVYLILAGTFAYQGLSTSSDVSPIAANCGQALSGCLGHPSPPSTLPT